MLHSLFVFDFVPPKSPPVTFCKMLIQPWHGLKIFGENYAKLKEIKRKYDPKGRLGGHFA